MDITDHDYDAGHVPAGSRLKLARCGHGKLFSEPCDGCADQARRFGHSLPTGSDVIDTNKLGANARQVGGDHYMANEYQHWDFVTDVKMPYLSGVGTKYMDRWPRKNGRQDVEKALHYAEKCKERNVPAIPPVYAGMLSRFCNQVADYDSREAIWAFATAQWDEAIKHINAVLARF